MRSEEEEVGDGDDEKLLLSGRGALVCSNDVLTGSDLWLSDSRLFSIPSLFRN